MRLTAKLVSMLVVAIAIILVLDGLLAVQREVELFHSDMRRDAHLLGAVLKQPIADAWQSGGKDQAFQLVADANQQEDRVSIRWVWLDTTGDTEYQPRVELDRLKDVCGGQDISLTSSGWIDVTSAPGKGSCFTVFLPVVPVSQVPVSQMKGSRI